MIKLCYVVSCVFCAVVLFHGELVIAEPQSRNAKTSSKTPATRAVQTEADACPVPEEKVYFVGKGNTICIPVTADDWTSLAMPPGVRVAFPDSSEGPDSSKFHHDYHRDTQALDVMAKRGTVAGTRVSIKVVGKGWKGTLLLEAGEKTRREVEVEYITKEEAIRREQAEAKRLELEAQLAETRSTLTETQHALTNTWNQLAATKREIARLETAVTTKDAELASKDAELERLAVQGKQDVIEAKTGAKEEAETAYLMNVAEELTSSRIQTLVPAEGYKEVVDKRLGLRFENAKYAEDHLVIKVMPQVLAGQRFRLGEVRTVTTTGQRLETRILLPAQSQVHQQQGTLATLRAGEEAPLVFAVKLPPGVCEKCLRLELYESGSSLTPAIAAMIPPEWRDGRILRPETTRERDERLAGERAERLGKQIIVGPRVSYGGCWLADAPGSSNLEAMGCTMLGMQVTQGFGVIGLEGEALGGWTGSSDMRNAKFGRAMLGIVARLGTDTIPYARVGIGGQVASVDGSGEFGGLFSAGWGVDKRLSNNVLIGIGLHYEESISDGVRFGRSVGIGAHISVGWNTSAKEE